MDIGPQIEPLPDDLGPFSNDVERDLLSGMANFVRKLQSGEPIEVTTLRREETPDGPLHTRERRILGERESSSNP